MFLNFSKQVVLCFVLLFFGTFIFTAKTAAQKVRLRGIATPDCSIASGNSDWKFADIYADGNIAVQGSYNCRGAFIYDISNPDAPVLASHYDPGNNQQFLEAIVVGTKGYFGSGRGNGGVHIVDLTDPYNPQLLGTVDSTHGNGFNQIHEMVIFGDFLIENYNGFSSKVLKVINISDPTNPVFIRDINPTEVNWVHAMHIRGNRMFTSGWGNSSVRGRTEIYDISNIASQAPTLLGFIEDSSGVTAGNNMHSSWTSEDGNYLYSARETSNGTGDIRVYDITDASQPTLVNRLTMQDLGLNAITPHNPVVMGNKLYVSWYQAGVQIFDISNPANPKHIGQYDTYQPEFTQSAQEKENLLFAEPWDLVCGSENLQNSLPNSYDGDWAVFPFLGEDKVLAGDFTLGLIVLDVTKTDDLPKNQVSDFDGDGKSDYSVYSPTNGNWFIETSSNGFNNSTAFGIAEDKLVTGDYDGDGRSDIAVWRPSNGTWYILGSQSGFQAMQFGAIGDVPVQADYDADGKTDIAIWRPTNGAWYIQQSSLGLKIEVWGLNGDKAFAGDYEGDGKADLVIFRPTEANWYILKSSSSQPMVAPFGLVNDIPITGDFDGDAISDIAVYRPSEGNWYIYNSNNKTLSVNKFGLPDDTPIPADYDGDGKTDIAVYRSSNNVWYRLNSSNDEFSARVFGQSGDIPTPTSVQP
jgi:hypothetical protein